MPKKPFAIINNPIGTRIDAIISYLNINLGIFAESLGYSQSNISQVRTGSRKATKRFFLAVRNEYPSINYNWLLTGEGEMLNSQIAESLSPYGKDDELLAEKIKELRAIYTADVQELADIIGRIDIAYNKFKLRQGEDDRRKNESDSFSETIRKPA